MSLLTYHTPDIIEVGVDEAGRGPLFGRLYCAAVIWPQELTTPLIKDSKKYTKVADRELAAEFVKDHAIAYGISYVDADQIDQINIFKATMLAMHEAIRQTHIDPDHILVDGNTFKPFADSHGDNPKFTTVVQGDGKYLSIAAASVLAKTAHDAYIKDTCLRYPILNRYDIQHNMGYGAPKHLEAIKLYGITQYHRQSFKCCTGQPITYI